MKSDPSRADFSCLPEGCISHVLSLTSPRDACRLSLVSCAFKSAADFDAVWEKFLPSDYQSILSRSSSPPPSGYCSKKELFFHLCEHPILIDNGRKSFSLDKWNGKKCYMLAARDITIKWSSTLQCWSWISLPDSRFPEVASLNFVGWLEIRGKIKTTMLSPRTKYAAYLVFKLRTDNHYYYGFRASPTEVSVHISGKEKHVQNVCLDLYLDQFKEEPQQWGSDRSGIEELLRSQQPKERKDGWFEIELGEYINGEVEDSELEMELMGVKGFRAKGGLIVQGIEVRPKEDA